MIRFDRTHYDVLAICTECGAREIFATQASAYTWAETHALRAHPWGPGPKRTVQMVAAARRRGVSPT